MTLASTTSVMNGISNPRRSPSAIHWRWRSSSEAPEKSSGSPLTTSAFPRKKRASNRRGRPGGVTARNTKLRARGSGRSPAPANSLHPSGASPGQSPSAPIISPVSSQSSRTAAANRRAPRPAAQPSSSLAAHGSGRSPAKGTDPSRESTAPPGKTNLSGMKAAPSPRWPIKTFGSVAGSRTRITVAASRMVP